MDWIVRNTSFLAFLLVAVAVLGIVLGLLATLSNFGQLGLSLAFGQMLSAALSLIAIAVGYGLLVRFLGLCDDMAAIRRAQTGNPASLD